MTRRNIKLYMAGPIQGVNLLESLRNLDYGKAMTAKAFQLGFSPFPVFADEQFLQRVRPVPAIQDVYNYSLEWLKVSDAMLVIDGWEHSKGPKAELEVAKEHGIPVFFDIIDLCSWADAMCENEIERKLRTSDD